MLILAFLNIIYIVHINIYMYIKHMYYKHRMYIYFLYVNSKQPAINIVNYGIMKEYIHESEPWKQAYKSYILC